MLSIAQRRRGCGGIQPCRFAPFAPSWGLGSSWEGTLWGSGVIIVQAVAGVDMGCPKPFYPVNK